METLFAKIQISCAAIALVPRYTNLIKEIFDGALGYSRAAAVATMAKKAEVDPECTFVRAAAVVLTADGFVPSKSLMKRSGSTTLLVVLSGRLRNDC